MSAQEYLLEKLTDVASDVTIVKDSGWSEPSSGVDVLKIIPVKLLFQES